MSQIFPNNCFPSLRHSSAKITILLILLMWITCGYIIKHKGPPSGWHTLTTITLRWCCPRCSGWGILQVRGQEQEQGAHWVRVKLLFREIPLLSLSSWSGKHSSYFTHLATPASPRVIMPALILLWEISVKSKWLVLQIYSIHYTDSRRWAEYIFLVYISLKMK